MEFRLKWWRKELFLDCGDELNVLGPSWMGLTHGNVIFDILEPSAFQKYSICWVFRAFFCSTFVYMYCNSTKTSANSIRLQLSWSSKAQQCKNSARCDEVRVVAELRGRLWIYDLLPTDGAPHVDNLQHHLNWSSSSRRRRRIIKKIFYKIKQACHGD